MLTIQKYEFKIDKIYYEFKRVINYTKKLVSNPENS